MKTMFEKISCPIEAERLLLTGNKKKHSYPDQNVQTITEQPESDSKNHRENEKLLARWSRQRDQKIHV